MLSNLKPGFALYKAFKDKLAERSSHFKYNLSAGNPLVPAFALAHEAAIKAMGQHEINVYGEGAGQKRIKKTALVPFCESLGILVEGRAPQTENVLIGHGSTSLYDYVVRDAARNAAKHRLASVPVILVPAPNYGLFCVQPDLCGIEIETLPLSVENSWQIDTATLENRIKEINATPGRHVALYYHANPHNPLGMVETPECGMALARILKAHDVMAIDDMAYWGQEYKNRAVPLAVHNICRSVTLFSISKTFGLPGLRGGFAVGDEKTITGMIDYASSSVQGISLPVQYAVGAAFSMQNEEAREDYIAQTRARYLERYEIVQAMIGGIKNLEEASAERKAEIQEIVKTAYGSLAEARSVLSSGMEDLELVNPDLQSGYFSILRLKEAARRYYGEQALTNSFKISAALIDREHILTLPGLSMLGKGVLDDSFRITFAFDHQTTLVHALKRLHKAVRVLTDKPNSEIEAQKVERGLQFDPSWS
jgi:aspartate/methionine/tyrosine aminotransferase